MGGTRRSNRVSVVPERLDYAEQAIKDLGRSGLAVWLAWGRLLR